MPFAALRSPFLRVAQAALCLGAAAGRAQEAGGEGALDELVSLLNTPVTAATRTVQASARVPATVVTVSAEQILRRRYRSLGELLRDLPECKVDNGFSVEHSNAVTVRGVLGQQKFVLLLDGNRIGAATNEVLPILENIPVHLAKQVEVVYGPASALYGADAFSGVINIVTFKGEEAVAQNHARLAGGDHQLWDAALAWTGALGPSTHLTVAGQGFRDDQPDLPSAYPEAYAGLQQALDSGIFPTVFGTKRATIPYTPEYAQPIRAHNLFLRLAREDWSVSVLQNGFQVPSAINYAPPNALPIADAYVAARTLTLAANHQALLREGLELQSALTGRRYEVSPQSRFINLFHPQMEPGYKYALSHSLRLEELLRWRASSSLEFSGGFSWESSEATPWGANLASPVDTGTSISSQGILLVGAPIEADFYTIRSTSYGVFAQGQYAAGPAWRFTAGARYDRDSRYGGTFNPRVGVVWTPSPALTFKLLYGSAFLAPSPYQAFRHYGGFTTTDGGATYQSDFWWLPNPGLKPERVQTLELSSRILLAPFLGVSANLTRSRYRDLHTPMPDAGNTDLYHGQYKGWPVAYIQVMGNQGRMTSLGGHLQVDLLLPVGEAGRLNLFAGYSCVDGKVEQDGRPEVDMGYVTPRLFKAGAEFAWGAWTGSALLTATGRQRTNGLVAGDSGARATVGGFRELNVAFGYRWRRLEAFLKAQNALDARYRNLNENAFLGDYEFKGMPQNPRRLSLGLRVGF